MIRIPGSERGRLRRIPFFVLSALLLFSAIRASASGIKVTWDPALVKRGSVVLLAVRTPVSLQAAEGSIGKDRFPLIRIAEGNYVALVGVDLKTEAPAIPVDLALSPARGGSPYRIRADLMIRDKVPGKTGVQELSLPAGMVDLTPKRVGQVKRDNRRLGDALAARSGERYWSKAFVMPLKGRISTRFGTRRILNGKPRSPHSGVDIAGRKGTPVKSANSGRVSMTEDFYLSGNTVVIDHGWGVSTIYAHLDDVKVREGQSLDRGEVIGTVGSTGRATGPHLHFGAFIRGAKVDPLLLIEATKRIGMRAAAPAAR